MFLGSAGNFERNELYSKTRSRSPVFCSFHFKVWALPFLARPIDPHVAVLHRVRVAGSQWKVNGHSWDSPVLLAQFTAWSIVSLCLCSRPLRSPRRRGERSAAARRDPGAGRVPLQDDAALRLQRQLHARRTAQSDVQRAGAVVLRQTHLRSAG